MTPPPPAYQRARTRSGALPLSTQIYQGIGALPETLQSFAFLTLLLFYYNQVLGLPATRASFALMISLVIDAFADPLVGSLSDAFHSRLGRRHPFMYASALPLGVALVATFSPPAGLSHAGLFAWLLGCAVAARLAMSFFSVPWNALYAELSDDYVERSAVVMWRYVVGWVGGLAFVLCVWSFVFPSTPEYTPGHLNPHAYGTFAILLGGAVALSALLSTHLTLRDVPYLLQPVAGSERASWRGFVRDLALAATNRDFVLLVVAILVTAAIAGTGTALDIYMLTYFWGLLPEDLRWFAFAIAGSALAFVAIPWLQLRFEKHKLLIACALFNLVNGFAVVGLRFAGAPALLPAPDLARGLLPHHAHAPRRDSRAARTAALAGARHAFLANGFGLNSASWNELSLSANAESMSQTPSVTTSRVITGFENSPMRPLPHCTTRPFSHALRSLAM